MSQPRSDNRQENHPKSVQNGSRKLIAGVEVDYADFADVLANTVDAFRPNKYYWIDGTYYHVDSDGTTFRPVGGGAAIKSLLFAINADGSGSPDDTFDGYKAAGPTLSDARLENVKVITAIVNGSGFQAYYLTGYNKIGYNSITGMGTLDFTATGGLDDQSYVIILYTQQ